MSPTVGVSGLWPHPQRGEIVLGVPLPIWGILCLLLAGVWLVVWPQKRVVGVSGLRFVVLRYFHALTWLLLGIAAFLAGFDQLGGMSSAKPVALLALAAYLLFLFMVATSSGS